MTDPPQECPTRITSPSARSIARLVAVTSSAREVVGFCTEITLYPLSTSGLITLFQEEPSAQSPWTKTIVGFVFIEPPVCANALEPRNNPPTSTKVPTFFIMPPSASAKVVSGNSAANCSLNSAASCSFDGQNNNRIKRRLARLPKLC